MRDSLLMLCLLLTGPVSAEVTPAADPAPKSTYDAALAERLGGNDRGMKPYVLVILTSGPNTALSKEERTKLFTGHMANINRLAEEGKLVIAGPMEENDRHYEGIFVFNVKTVPEAEALLNTDPAVAGGALAYEAYGWYATAALMEMFSIHKRIDKLR